MAHGGGVVNLPVMHVLSYSTHAFDQPYLDAANAGLHELTYLSEPLTEHSVSRARGVPAVCGFFEDDFSAPILERLAEGGTRLVLLRSIGYDNVDLDAARRLGIAVFRVARYSPWSVAELAVGLVHALHRHLHRVYVRGREYNFSLDGLVGRDLHGCTVGIVGTGQIGSIAARLFGAYGCTLLASAPRPNAECEAMGVRYVSLQEMLAASDVVTLHAPLKADTRHLMNADAFARMKPGAVLINVARGGLVDSAALLDALERGQLAGAGLDVYEREKGVFYRDRSADPPHDPVLAALLARPDVIVTGHEAWVTEQALATIGETTIRSIADFEAGRTTANRLA